MLKHSTLRLSKRLGLLLFACMFFVALGYSQNASAVVRVSAGVDFHTGGYDLLSQYGDWMRVPPYGVVWCPYVDASWAPFYDGRWIRTRGGWAWDSYEPFGDIVFHYGYWYFENDIGWFWVPGNEWSPARVQWYTYGSYCGWAPLPPPNYYWPNPWDFCDLNIWVVVHIDNFCDDHIGRHGIDRLHYRDVFRRDGVVKRAPDFRRVETVLRRQIPVQTITKRPMDIRTDKIKVAEKPVIRRDVKVREPVPAQRNVRNTKQIATPAQRQVVTPRNDVKAKREVAAPQSRTRATSASGSSGMERKATERKVAVEKQSVRSERQIAKTAMSRQSERQVAARRANSQPQRQVVAQRKNARAAKEKAEKK